MALNFSQRPVTPIWSPENGGEGDRFGRRREIVDKSSSQDIIDLLPADPFGMDLDISTTFSAITEWLGDLDLEYGDWNKFVNYREEYRLFAGFNVVWNSALRFQSCNVTCNDQRSKGCIMTKNEEDVHNLIGGEPHEAFVLALSYLGIKDLFTVERVCKSLCNSVRGDSLLWRNLFIDQPLNEKITDDILVKLTNRAEGSLQCLSLIKCPKITDDGLKCVLETNPKLTKLFIPGCTRLSIEGIMNNLKAFNSNTETAGIKQIRMGGFFGITLDDFENLKCLLGIQKSDTSPRYYHRANLYFQSDDDRAIDVEVCPRCKHLRLVYDCPADGCQPKDKCPDLCRACIICIPRCAECGRCVHNSEYEETFSLDYLCSDCLKHYPRCQETQEMQIGIVGDPSHSTALHG
nr:hypothetical protein [Tanacetum cinerariifolium]